MAIVGIIIPTWNAPQMLLECVNSIMRYTQPEDLFHIYIVNNGDPEHMNAFKGSAYVTILQQERNVGWEGGLKAGLEASKEPYVLFMNDDTVVPSHQRLWLTSLLNHFADIDCAAVGPTSNVVMGKQQMFIQMAEHQVRTKFLIGFCILVRRADIDAAGGIDVSLPGGDDLDLSIRLRKLGKYLLVDRNVFVYHHGFKTGERVHGSDWNSLAMLERTNFALINKHGLPAYLDLWTDEVTPSNGVPQSWGDTESEICRQYATGDKIAEIGCGDKKIIPYSVGIDITPKGQEIPGLSRGRLSVADLTANVEEPLPISDFDSIIAQHVLEHLCDTVGAVMAWKNALKHGGRLIIAVPDHSVRNTIPMNHEHKRGFTPDSLRKEMELMGFKTVDLLDAKNNVSFVGVFQRNGD